MPTILSEESNSLEIQNVVSVLAIAATITAVAELIGRVVGVPVLPVST
jgi:hypothetical protein